MFTSIRFILSTSIAYTATLSVIGYALVAPQHSQTIDTQRVIQSSLPVSSTPRPAVISGTPAHISLPSHAIDLPVDTGVYSPETHTWSLSDTRAQFATLTMPTNDSAGTTLIYGHATAAVFGALASSPPAVGTLAQVKATNGTIFSYTFTHSETLAPHDTSLFSDVTSGAPRLVLQTCTGAFSEWRTMYYFKFEGVAKP